MRGAAVATQDHDFSKNAASATHAALSWWHGYWARVGNRGITGGLIPDSFCTHSESIPAQYDSYDLVFFGYGDLYMFRYTNGQCSWGGISMDNDLKQLCSKWIHDGWVFGKNTYLCPYDSKYYFITWVKGSESRCTWNVQENGILNDELISEVIRGVGRNTESENAYYE
jgi:hypothetical protein